MKVTLILGTRPQIIKSAPLIHLAKKDTEIDMQIIHTGQHYDYEMSKEFFDELNLPDPTANLNIGSGTHAWQTGKMLIALEKVLMKEKPDLVIVPGDTNSTIAGALSASKLHIPVAHMEAGERSYNMDMPEEINRRLTDHCSTLLFAATKKSVNNLWKEGVDQTKIHLVGDTMYDSVLNHLPEAMKESLLEKLSLQQDGYAVLTAHRPENVDSPKRLEGIVDAMVRLADLTIMFPIHPRTKSRLQETGFQKKLKKNVRIIKPLKYREMLNLMKNAKLLLTDSGGMQKEAFWLETACVTLRNETEWTETIELGANVLVGTDPEKIVMETNRILSDETRGRKLSADTNPFGNGRASEKILSVIKDFYSGA
ncbi:MAG: UDP-N-acetylglucosamine 2-epimerase (non-hydrolyzing) [Candidatus Bathyarchaeum sp.]|nr:MAG: UDP-N-acetylglucosamine 2-epimerase (non-hydrolyzing) [Candidatus Bathyarchaeum sp.]